MENINTIKVMLYLILTPILTFVGHQIGGFDKWNLTLIIFMAIDFLLGSLVAFVKHKSPKTLSGKGASTPLFIGLVKKFIVLCLVAMAYRMDILLEVDYLRYATIGAFCIQEFVSIQENAALFGIKLPEKLVNALDLLDKDTQKRNKQ